MATLLERMTSAGISEDRVRSYIEEGWVRQGETVLTDPDAEQLVDFVIAPGVTEHQATDA